MTHAERVKQAIDEFNARGLSETYFDSVVRVRARLPILATDCDYEIVRISGVQGVRLPPPEGGYWVEAYEDDEDALVAFHSLPGDKS